jgi:thiol-disulfide isomerase/thioredoxin
MINIIDVKEGDNIEKFNAAAKQAHDNPDTHGLLIKVYADWCGYCKKMTSDWARLINELKHNYSCKKSGCVLTIANIQAVDMEPNDPVLQNLEYIPKDINSIPTIVYVRKGVRGLEYSNKRVYSEMLKWIVSNPDFELMRRHSKKTHHRGTLHGITKKARTKFKDFHRDTLKRFHKEMRRQHKKSVRSRMPTPVALMPHQVPAYLRQT